MKTNELNFIVDNEFLQGDECALFFQDEDVIFISEHEDMFDILTKHIPMFRSRIQARKNWKLTGHESPPGFSDFKGLGKMKWRITIFNATIMNKHNGG